MKQEVGRNLFTGLIEELGILRRLSISTEGANLVIDAKSVLADLKKGDSIAVSGPCLTVTTLDSSGFTAWAMPETLQKTNLGTFKTGRRVNLERALALGGRLGGHLVSGHIDTVVTLTGKESQGGALVLSFTAPGNLLRYIIPKGSVALDGVSLTVIEVNDHGFSVGLIPHTASQTTLAAEEIGRPVNLEVDMIGKYVEKMLLPHLEENNSRSSISMDLLRQKGYL